MGYDKTMKIETKGETMKTIKIRVEAGVVQEVTIPKEYEDTKENYGTRPICSSKKQKNRLGEIL